MMNKSEKLHQDPEFITKSNLSELAKLSKNIAQKIKAIGFVNGEIGNFEIIQSGINEQVVIDPKQEDVYFEIGEGADYIKTSSDCDDGVIKFRLIFSESEAICEVSSQGGEEISFIGSIDDQGKVVFEDKRLVEFNQIADSAFSDQDKVLNDIETTLQRLEETEVSFKISADEIEFIKNQYESLLESIDDEYNLITNFERKKPTYNMYNVIEQIGLDEFTGIVMRSKWVRPDNPDDRNLKPDEYSGRGQTIEQILRGIRIECKKKGFVLKIKPAEQNLISWYISSKVKYIEKIGARNVYAHDKIDEVKRAIIEYFNHLHEKAHPKKKVTVSELIVALGFSLERVPLKTVFKIVQEQTKLKITKYTDLNKMPGWFLEKIEEIIIENSPPNDYMSQREIVESMGLTLNEWQRSALRSEVTAELKGQKVLKVNRIKFFSPPQIEKIIVIIKRNIEMGLFK